MKNLVIVESPSKSKTIEKYLGSDYHVVSSKGHIRDLATTGKGGLGIDVEHELQPQLQDQHRQEGRRQRPAEAGEGQRPRLSGERPRP